MLLLVYECRQVVGITAYTYAYSTQLTNTWW